MLSGVIMKFLIWFGRSNDSDYQTAKTTPFIKAYSSFFSQVILIFTFILALILTLIFMSDSYAIPGGILGNFFTGIPLKCLIISFFIISSLFLFIGIRSLYKTNIGRIKRATIFYELYNRKSPKFQKTWYDSLNDYENTLFQKFWKVEKKKYNLMKNQYLLEISNSINSIKRLIVILDNRRTQNQSKNDIKNDIHKLEILGIDVLCQNEFILEILKKNINKNGVELQKSLNILDKEFESVLEYIRQRVDSL